MTGLLMKRYKDMLTRAYEDLMNDSCEVDEEQAMRIVAIIAHRPLSKDKVCEEVLHWSRSKFDDYVSRGMMPAGRKRRGWKELAWYEDEVLDSLERIKKEYNIQ